MIVLTVGTRLYTKEYRACLDEGMCGESVTQKTHYEVIEIDNRLVAKCLDYEAIRELGDLKYFGLSWSRPGFFIGE